MQLTRRSFLRAGAASMTAFFLPGPFVRAAAASTTSPVLVALYLRGGADPLTLIPPAFDPLYYSNRPNIQVPPGTELALSDGFGMNPVLAPLHPLYQSGDLAVIHASGSKDPSRSHFDCQDFMERAAPGNKSVTTGWLNRYLSLVGGGQAISGLTLAKKKTKSLAGPAPAIAFSSVANFAVSGQYVDERRAALELRYEPQAGVLGQAVRDGFGVLDVVGAVDTTTPVVYPTTGLAATLADAAALIKADIGIRALTVDLGGWDHHSDQTPRIGALGDELSGALAAFYEDLGPCQATTLTLCMTEFGRRVAENGAGGTDHGHGGVLFALGGGISGGRVLLRDDTWPGLEVENLWNGQDLEVTTDFRDVFAEALNAHMGLSTSQMGSIFPGFSVDAANFPGLYT